MNARRSFLASLAIISSVALPLTASAAIKRPSVKATTTTTTLPTQVNSFSMASFNPAASSPAGTKDLYHCALIDPGFTEDRYITKSLITPGNSAIVHHSILFLVEASKAATARAKDNNGQGWTCFGAPLNNLGVFDGTPWLGAGVPGNQGNPQPVGTGVFVPAGSLLVLQVHYNLLGGSGSDASSVELTTVRASQSGGNLKAMQIDPLAAPVDLPCPKGTVRNANPALDLCNRSNSMADLQDRFGFGVALTANMLEIMCGHQPPTDDPKKAHTKKVTVTCTQALPAGVLRTVTPHMHLLGVSWKATASVGGRSVPVLNVPHYNFDQQTTTVLKKPITVPSGSTITFSCTFDPTLRSKIGQTKDLPPRYVTWGDGSADEMCMAILGRTAS